MYYCHLSSPSCRAFAASCLRHCRRSPSPTCASRGHGECRTLHTHAKREFGKSAQILTLLRFSIPSRRLFSFAFAQLQKKLSQLITQDFTMESAKVPVKLVKVTRVLGRTGTSTQKNNDNPPSSIVRRVKESTGKRRIAHREKDILDYSDTAMEDCTHCRTNR